jgi:oligopeptide transport system ATP-binding protein
VSEVEPDTRFTAVDLRDDGLEEGEPSDLENMRDRHDTLAGDVGHAPQEVTRLIDEQPGDHRPPNA